MTFLQLCDPGWYVQKSDVQNKGDDKANHTTVLYCMSSVIYVQYGIIAIIYYLPLVSAGPAEKLKNVM